MHATRVSIPYFCRRLVASLSFREWWTPWARQATQLCLRRTCDSLAEYPVTTYSLRQRPTEAQGERVGQLHEESLSTIAACAGGHLTKRWCRSLTRKLSGTATSHPFCSARTKASKLPLQRVNVDHGVGQDLCRLPRASKTNTAWRRPDTPERLSAVQQHSPPLHQRASSSEA